MAAELGSAALEPKPRLRCPEKIDDRLNMILGSRTACAAKLRAKIAPDRPQTYEKLSKYLIYLVYVGTVRLECGMRILFACLPCHPRPGTAALRHGAPMQACCLLDPCFNLLVL